MGAGEGLVIVQNQNQPLPQDLARAAHVGTPFIELDQDQRLGASSCQREDARPGAALHREGLAQS